ncbi:hypothetical protein BDP55DRAFT_772147 [Colletotrichum godetiae]|uniref:F-box domain-containing protein n=1 Tax=Colletotrichum godetiae TaxID=1209918 RepID=A0AAJ0ABL9_9PEZI|nr:uncharacterized protein BDP55DRAFT_772147 [Colletotrichum godetiae]KAK1660051.1 hypothetical protein BDP55DRAFT_772147 [Colletotrichum godetiae]
MSLIRAAFSFITISAKPGRGRPRLCCFLFATQSPPASMLAQDKDSQRYRLSHFPPWLSRVMTIETKEPRDLYPLIMDDEEKMMKLKASHASYLTTIHVHDTCSLRIPKGIRLEHLRSLTFASCSMDRSSLKHTLQATPKLVSFEYHTRPSTANDFDRTEPPLRNGRGEAVSAVPPESHRQLRMLVIDFPVGEDESTWWKREETITNMRNLRLLKHLSIDADSIISRFQGGEITVNDLDELILEKLEGLTITRVGDSFDYLMQTSLPELARELRNGRSCSLHRVGILHCAIDEFTRYNALDSL